LGNILVIYDSQSGYTKNMAQLVAKGAAQISGHEIHLKSVDEATHDDILWADGVAVGSPTHLGLVSAKMKAFWDGITDIWGQIDGKFACAFSSSGGWGGGNELACLSILILLMNYGFLVFGLTDYVGKQFTLHYGSVMAGEPRRDEEIASCLRLGKRLAQWVAFYVDGRKDQHPGPIKDRQ
jgi:NAD(P)H dehydrogenase (quinone)